MVWYLPMYPYIYPSQKNSPENPSFYVESGPTKMWLNLASSPRRSPTSVKCAILKQIPVPHVNRALPGPKLRPKWMSNLAFRSPNWQNLRCPAILGDWDEFVSVVLFIYSKIWRIPVPHNNRGLPGAKLCPIHMSNGPFRCPNGQIP